jgi:hypothetical protein
MFKNPDLKPDADLLPLQLCESDGIMYSFAYLQP